MTLRTPKLSRSRESMTGFLFLALLSAIVYMLVSLTLRRVEIPVKMDMDEQEYYNLASAFMHGDRNFDPRRPPIYMLIIYLIRLFTGDDLVATRAVVAIGFSTSAPLMYLLARRFTGCHGFALWMGVATMFWPPFLYYGSSLYSETLALPVFILALLAIPLGSLVAGGAPERGWRAGLAGIVIGVCMLMRPMYLLFAPFAVAILFLEESDGMIAIRRVLLLIAACLLIVAPWSAYLSTKSGKFIFVSANGGETLAGGLNPVLLEHGYWYFTTPDGRRSWYGPGKWVNETTSGYLNADEQKLPYAQRSTLLEHRAMAWGLTHPVSALRLELAKLAYMWGVYPFWNGLTQTVLGNIPTVGALGLAVVSLAHFRKCLRQLSRFWLLPLFSSAVALVSWGSWRFREPGDLGLIMLAGLLVWSVAMGSRRRGEFGRIRPSGEGAPLGVAPIPIKGLESRIET